MNAYLETLRRPPLDMASLRASCPPDLKEKIESLNGPHFERFLSAYSSIPSMYDQPFSITSINVSTYANPSTMKRLVDTMRGRFGTCARFNVLDIELVKKTVGSQRGLPVFVMQPIKYVEAWSITCDEEKRSFEVSFARDSEGPTGVYTVK